ncbi:hypothetical protein [Brachybacterium tyrofermentans]|uniref:hypothetical protein n=1 Tax=Brachybacterium tyrofermentans TaxID=47848 RepID=UPI003FD06E8E
MVSKAQLEGWEVVRQDTAKLQSTLKLRKPRPSTAMESILDRMPVVGGMADAHRHIVLIGALLVVLALIVTPLAIMTAGDADVAAPTSSAPAEEPAAVESDEQPEPEKTSAEEDSSSP